jgi:hypothetical protein
MGYEITFGSILLHSTNNVMFGLFCGCVNQGFNFSFGRAEPNEPGLIKEKEYQQIVP